MTILSNFLSLSGLKPVKLIYRLDVYIGKQVIFSYITAESVLLPQFGLCVLSRTEQPLFNVRKIRGALEIPCSGTTASRKIIFFFIILDVGRIRSRTLTFRIKQHITMEKPMASSTFDWLV